MSAKARTMGRAVVACLCCAWWALAPWTARAEDYHVHTSVELHAALGEASNNGEDDTITLAPGTYSGGFDYHPQEAQALVLRAEPGAGPGLVIVEGQEWPADAALELDCGPAPGAAVRLQDLTVQGGYASGLNASCWGGVLDLTLERVVIQDNTTVYDGAGASFLVVNGAQVQATLQDCVVRNNEAPGHDGRSGRGGGLHGVAYGGGSHLSLTLVNTLVYGNRSNWPGGGLSLVVDEPGTDNVLRATLINTTVTGNLAGMHGTQHWGGGLAVTAWRVGITNTVEMYNSIVYGNESGGGATPLDIGMDAGQPAEARVDAFYCDVGDVNPFGGTYNGTSCQQADPLFRNASAGDLHLTSRSPCIDTGTTDVPDPPGLPAMDMDGEPRVYGAAPDIGADEYAGEVMLWLPVILKRST